MIRRMNRDLDEVLLCYGTDVEFEYYDAEEPLDTQLLTFVNTPEKLVAAREELASILADPELGDYELGLATTSFVGLPAGGDWRDWLTYVLGRIDAVLADPSEVAPPLAEGFAREAGGVCRRSHYPDKATAEGAVRDVLRTHEHRLRAWVADQQGVPRLHLYADLGRPIGTSTELDWYGDPSAEPVEVSGCVVLLRVDAESGNPVVVTSYPELQLDLATRERYPDLVLVFGGYFGQDVQAIDLFHWQAEHRLNREPSPAVLDRITVQLGELLTVDDAALRLALQSLGSYTMPRDPRRWVRGLLRRRTSLDWTIPLPSPR